MNKHNRDVWVACSNGATLTLPDAIVDLHIATFAPARQFTTDNAAQPAEIGTFARTGVWLVIALAALNVISTLLECGFRACPDNPVVYELLRRAP